MESDHSKYMPRPRQEREEDETQAEAPQEVSITEDIAITEEAAFDPGEEISRVSAEQQARTAAESPREENAEEIPMPAPLSLLNGLLSPLLVPTYVTLIIFLISILSILAPDAALPYTLTVFGATCVVPLISLYVLNKVGATQSFELYSARERVVPYIIEIMALGGVTLFLVFKGANTWIWSIFCGGTAVALANFLINFRMRVSTCCSAMAAMVAALIVINRYGFPRESLFWWTVGAVFFAGVAGSLALLYRRHSLWEVLAGYATGFLGIILFSLLA